MRLSKSVMRPMQKLYSPRGFSFAEEEVRRKSRSSSYASLECSEFCKLNCFGCDSDGLTHWTAACFGEPFDTSSIVVHGEMPWNENFLEPGRGGGDRGRFASDNDSTSSMRGQTLRWLDSSHSFPQGRICIATNARNKIEVNNLFN